MAKETAPLSEQQQALDELQQQAETLDDQLVINDWQNELDAQAQQRREINQEELKAVTNKHGNTQFLVKGINAETGRTYHRQASKKEVNDQLGAFNDAVPEAAAIEEEKKELTPDQIGGLLNQLLDGYQQKKSNFAPTEELEETRNMIFGTFEQLKTAYGWEGDELAEKQDMLFSEMGDPAPLEGEVEEVALPGETKDQTMDRIMKDLGAKPAPKLKTRARPLRAEKTPLTDDAEEISSEHLAITDEAQETVLTTEEKGMWDEMKGARRLRGKAVAEDEDHEPQHMKKETGRFARARKFGNAVLVNLGLRPDPNQGPTIEAPNRRSGAVEETSGQVRIQAERAADAAELARRAAEEDDEKVA